MRLRLGFVVLFLVACCTPAAFGQALVDGAVVKGNSFKPAPGYTVHLVNKSMTPLVDETQVTGPDGRYSFENVIPGENYAVDVYDATGKLIGTDPRFAVGPNAQHTAIPDIDITRGMTAERTALSGGLIENDRGISPGANISNQQLRELPLYNRNFLVLGLIQPGVHDVEQGSPLQGAGFSIAGSQSTSTNFLLDGVDNVASSSNQAIPFQVNEAVREFRVVYATPSMQYGQGAGGVVDVLTSSGDNGSAGKGWHGSAFFYYNGDSLNANAPLSVYSNSGFAKASAYAGGSAPYAYPTQTSSQVISVGGSTSTSSCANLATSTLFCGYSPQSYNALFGLLGQAAGLGLDPNGATSLFKAGAFNPGGVLATQDSHTEPINSKQFGASFGGPLGDRLFLFLSYEGTLINNPTPIFERVPTFLDKPSAANYPNLNASDKGIAQNILGLFPAPNVGQTGTSLIPTSGTGVLGFFRGTAPNYTNVHNVELRPDLSLKRLGTATFRFTGQLIDQLHDDTLPAGGAYPGNGANRRAQNQNAALSYNFPFGESRNLLAIAFTQFRVDEVAQDRSFNASALGVPAGAMPTIVLSGVDPQTTAPVLGGQGVMGGWYDSFWKTNCSSALTQGTCLASGTSSRSPSAVTPSLDGDFPLARIGAPLSAPSKHRDTEAFVSDALELHLAHRSTLTLGGDFRYQQNFSFDGSSTRGLIVSNNIGEFTSDSETCVSCGVAFQHPSFDYELKQPTGFQGDLRSQTFGLFVEHRFQVTDRLTLVAGARYDHFGQPLDTLNRLWNYNTANQGVNRQGATGTFDAFDYQCGGGTTFFDSVYGDRRASIPKSGWACNTGGTFQLPTDNKNGTGLLGVAFSPDKERHDVIRASVGGYYDHQPASYNQKLLLNRPSPYSVANPSSIYGQNFSSTYSSAACPLDSGGHSTQCAFGLNTLNFGSANFTAAQTSTFQNYQAASAANIQYERDPLALKTPVLVQFQASYEHRFGGSWTGELGYVGSVGSRLPLVYDSNYANEFYCSQTGVCNNDTYFPVFTESNIGASNYNSMVARIEGRLFHGLSMHASYTFAKSLDNIAGSQFPASTDSLFTQLFGRQLFGLGNPVVSVVGQQSAGFGSNGGLRNAELGNKFAANGGTGIQLEAGIANSANIPSFSALQSALTTTGSRAINTSHYSLPQDPTKFSSNGAATGADYGRSDFDVRHRAVADFVYNVPDFGHSLLGGFLVSGITTFQTGQPFSIFSGPAYGQVTQLANLPSSSSVSTSKNPAGYFSGVSQANLPSFGNANCPNLYAQPTLYVASSVAAACSGNSGRNSFTGPAYFSQDLAVQKTTRLAHDSKKNIVLRAEVFNVFNRANYYNPISELSNDGVHINPEFGLTRSAHDPFQLQLAARVNF